MAGIEMVLQRLDGVRRTGGNSWIAKCPAHADRTPSLSVRETDDRRVLVHCFGGNCAFEEIVAAIGLSASDLAPERPHDFHSKPGERRPFPASDILQAISFEATIVLACGAAMQAGKFTSADRERLALAIVRIQGALDAGGIR